VYPQEQYCATVMKKKELESRRAFRHGGYRATTGALASDEPTAQVKEHRRTLGL
jgi:hypothetical protein